MNRNLIKGLPALLVLALSLPAVAAFQQYQSFPQPAPTAFGIVGTGLPDGRIIVWNGDQVIVESAPGVEQYDTIASGYAGDPGFIALSPTWDRLILGAGFSGMLYELDPANPVDFSPAQVVAVQSHFAGDFLTNDLLLVDAGKPDFSGSELAVVNLSGAKSAPRVAVRKSSRYAHPKDAVVDKPPFSYSTSLYVDRAAQKVYAMDGNTRELRVFDASALVNAYQTQTPLDWETDGALLGAPGEYFTGGVSGVLPSGDLVIGGSEGFGMPGGIQLVDRDSGVIVDVLDPLGNQSYYSVIFNPFRSTIIARAETGEVFAPEDAFAEMPAAGLAEIALLATALLAVSVRRINRRQT